MTQTPAVEQRPATTNASFLDVLKIRNVRLLWIGGGIPLLGGRFYMIACLALSLTASPRLGR